MIGSVLAEIRKVSSTRLWIGLAIGGALMAGVGAVVLFIVADTPEGRASGLEPIETTRHVGDLVLSGAVMSAFCLVLGATLATSEYRYGTAAITALATPSRARVLTAKMIAAVPIGFALGVLGGLVPLLIAAIAFTVRGDAFPYGNELLVDVVLVALQCTYAAALAVAVGQAIRSQLVAILGLLGWLFIAESVAVGLLPDVATWMPFAGAQNAFGAESDALLSKPAGAALMLAYLASGWLVAWWLDRRRDV